MIKITYEEYANLIDRIEENLVADGIVDFIDDRLDDIVQTAVDETMFVLDADLTD